MASWWDTPAGSIPDSQGSPRSATASCAGQGRPHLIALQRPNAIISSWLWLGSPHTSHSIPVLSTCFRNTQVSYDLPRKNVYHWKRMPPKRTYPRFSFFFSSLSFSPVLGQEAWVWFSQLSAPFPHAIPSPWCALFLYWSHFLDFLQWLWYQTKYRLMCNVKLNVLEFKCLNIKTIFKNHSLHQK